MAGLARPEHVFDALCDHRLGPSGSPDPHPLSTPRIPSGLRPKRPCPPPEGDRGSWPTVMSSKVHSIRRRFSSVAPFYPRPHANISCALSILSQSPEIPGAVDSTHVCPAFMGVIRSRFRISGLEDEDRTVRMVDPSFATANPQVRERGEPPIGRRGVLEVVLKEPP